MILGGIVAASRFLPRAWRRNWAGLVLASATICISLITRSPLAWLTAALLTLIARGGLWRLAVGRQKEGLLGMAIGLDEMRLAGVWSLTALFLSVLSMLAFVALLCGAYAAASAGRGFDASEVATWAPAIEGGPRILLGLIALLCFVGIAYCAARVSLAEPATIKGSRIKVLSTFALTRDRALGLAVAQLVVAAPAIGAGFWGSMRDYNFGWALAQSLALMALWLPMSVGLMAYAYDVCAPKK